MVKRAAHAMADEPTPKPAPMPEPKNVSEPAATPWQRKIGARFEEISRLVNEVIKQSAMRGDSATSMDLSQTDVTLETLAHRLKTRLGGNA